jgi:hypothetical protein
MTADPVMNAEFGSAEAGEVTLSLVGGDSSALLRRSAGIAAD